MQVPPVITRELLEKVQFCCVGHMAVYAYKMAAQYLEEALGDRPCLICGCTENVNHTGFEIPAGQVQREGTPPLSVQWYKVCDTCKEIQNLDFYIEKALLFEIIPAAEKSTLVH